MLLSIWMARKGYDDASFAQLLTEWGQPVDRASVSRWRRGVNTPRPPQMRAIIEATKGQVGAADLLVPNGKAA